MTDDKNLDKQLFDKIKAVIDAKDLRFEEEAESAAKEDALIIDKIQAIIEKDEAFLDNVDEQFRDVLEAMGFDDAVIDEEPAPATEESAAEEAEELPAEESSAEEEAEELPAEEPAEDAPIEEELPSDDKPADEEELVAVEETEPAEQPLPEPPTGEHKKHWMTTIEEKFKAIEAKSKLGIYFTKNRHNATLGVVVLMLLLTSAIVGIDYLIPQKLIVEYITFDGTKEMRISSRASDIESIIEDANIDVSEHDYVYPSLDHKIKDGETITIKKSVKTQAEIIGKNEEFYLIPGTVEENLEFNKVPFDKDDMAAPKKDVEVAANTKIVFKEVHFSEEEKQEKVAAKNVVMLDPSLYSGKVAKTEGHDGEGVFTYRTTYVNGVATRTDKEVKEWITEPVDHALRLGTSLTGHKGTYTVSRTFIANTTAYYMGEGARGASGGRCVYGTCAVDPRVFPYGTVLFVEGYGIAIANDCGGAVKGNILDLWMHSYRESVNWGRRHVKAYVLK